MATLETLMKKITRIEDNIQYIKFRVLNEKFDSDTILFIFENIKIPDIDKIIEKKKKQDKITKSYMNNNQDLELNISIRF